MTIQADPKVTFPGYSAEIRGLVEQHKQLIDEPVLLAVYYAPARDPLDVFLFEVLDGYAGNNLDDSDDMLEVQFGPTPHFPLHSRFSRLHIIMTNPTEFQSAADRKTERFQELKSAMNSGLAHVIYEDSRWSSLRAMLD